VRIDQVIPVLRGQNAVGAHTLNVQTALRTRGIESEIFYEEADEAHAGRGKPLGHVFDPVPDRIVLFQAAIGSPAFNAMARIEDRLFLNYHNITPAELIEPWEPEIAAIGLARGRNQLAGLARSCEFALAVSTFNQRELIDLGYRRTAVAPLLIDMSPSTRADPTLLASLLRAKVDRSPSLLFVGQRAPHKAPHDLVAMLAVLKELYAPDATLTLVGQAMGSTYPEALASYIDELGLARSVTIVDGAQDAELEAYWQASDIYVCASDHEGFCAPLIEAMAHDLPVVAFGSSAIPDTVADAGLVLGTKDPVTFAGAVHRVLSDGSLSAELIARGRARAGSFELGRSSERFVEVLLEGATSS
jgi:glycosyltransferase involved in cell wall biosynthesis